MISSTNSHRNKTNDEGNHSSYFARRDRGGGTQGASGSLKKAKNFREEATQFA